MVVILVAKLRHIHEYKNPGSPSTFKIHHSSGSPALITDIESTMFEILLAWRKWTLPFEFLFRLWAERQASRQQNDHRECGTRKTKPETYWKLEQKKTHYRRNEQARGKSRIAILQHEASSTNLKQVKCRTSAPGGPGSIVWLFASCLASSCSSYKWTDLKFFAVFINHHT